MESSGNTLGKEITHRYTSNLAITHHFFETDELNVIRGDSIFADKPLIHIPEIKIRRSNISRFIAQDTELKLDMEKAMDALKKDGYIVPTFEESILLNEELKSLDWEGGWLRYVSIATTCLVLLMAVHMVHSTIKIAKLAALIATVQAQGPRADTTETDKKLIFRYELPTVEAMLERGTFGIQVYLQEKVGGYVWIILGLVALEIGRAHV